MSPYRVTVTRKGETEERSADFPTLKDAEKAARQEWYMDPVRVALWRLSGGTWFLRYEQGRQLRENEMREDIP